MTLMPPAANKIVPQPAPSAAHRTKVPAPPIRAEVAPARLFKTMGGLILFLSILRPPYVKVGIKSAEFIRANAIIRQKGVLRKSCEIC